MPTTELVTTLKRNATKIIAKARRNRESVLITEHGLPAAYLVDAKTYEDMQSRMKILEGIALGEKAISEGRVHTHAEAMKKMKRWLK
jgi:prevent-host-death family protein